MKHRSGTRACSPRGTLRLVVWARVAKLCRERGAVFRPAVYSVLVSCQTKTSNRCRSQKACPISEVYLIQKEQHREPNQHIFHSIWRYQFNNHTGLSFSMSHKYKCWSWGCIESYLLLSIWWSVILLCSISRRVTKNILELKVRALVYLVAVL